MVRYSLSWGIPYRDMAMTLGGKGKSGLTNTKEQYKRRFSACGKFKKCYRCDKDIKVEDFYTKMSHCKFCQQKIAKKAYDKRTKSLW